jgi:hypothetical protein
VHKRLIGAPKTPPSAPASRGGGAEKKGIVSSEAQAAAGTGKHPAAAEEGKEQGSSSKKGSLFSRRRIRVNLTSINNKSSEKATGGSRPWTASFGAGGQKKFRRKQPLGPPPDGGERLGRLLDVLQHHVVFQGGAVQVDSSS